MYSINEIYIRLFAIYMLVSFHFRDLTDFSIMVVRALVVAKELIFS